MRLVCPSKPFNTKLVTQFRPSLFELAGAKAVNPWAQFAYEELRRNVPRPRPTNRNGLAFIACKSEFGVVTVGTKLRIQYIVMACKFDQQALPSARSKPGRSIG